MLLLAFELQVQGFELLLCGIGIHRDVLRHIADNVHFVMAACQGISCILDNCVLGCCRGNRCTLVVVFPEFVAAVVESYIAGFYPGFLGQEYSIFD